LLHGGDPLVKKISRKKRGTFAELLDKTAQSSKLASVWCSSLESTDIKVLRACKRWNQLFKSPDW
jgi:hypothetical protein